MMPSFEFPTTPHLRRHGPVGYKNYGSYRDWLRDEFKFRCVFCLHREQWYGRSGTFDIEHFVPVAINPNGKCEYHNLLYACRTCNSAKQDIISVPDPCIIAFGDCLQIQRTGEVAPLNADGKRLCEVLRLNSKSNVAQRSRWMRMLEALQQSHPDLYREFMAFPEALPDLRRNRVPENMNPGSVHDCCFALRERGELPDTY